jgi:hypothetical protein
VSTPMCRWAREECVCRYRWTRQDPVCLWRWKLFRKLSSNQKRRGEKMSKIQIVGKFWNCIYLLSFCEFCKTSIHTESTDGKSPIQREQIFVNGRHAERAEFESIVDQKSQERGSQQESCLLYVCQSPFTLVYYGRYDPFMTGFMSL